MLRNKELVWPLAITLILTAAAGLVCGALGGWPAGLAASAFAALAGAVWLADEPTGNLDSRNSAEIMALLRRFHEEKGQTLLVITHDERIARQADRLITIEDGRITRDEAVRP